MIVFQPDEGVFIACEDNVLRFEGNFVKLEYVHGLEAALGHGMESLDFTLPVTLDMVRSEECASFLLKPVLNWIKVLLSRTRSLRLLLAAEDGELLPWHRTLEQCLHDFKPESCECVVEKEELCG